MLGAILLRKTLTNVAISTKKDKKNNAYVSEFIAEYSPVETPTSLSISKKRIIVEIVEVLKKESIFKNTFSRDF